MVTETVIRLPCKSNDYKVHAWLSDRFESHRNDNCRYVFASRQSDQGTVVAIFHDQPISGLAQGSDIFVPREGDVVRFRARLNPTMRRGQKRVPIPDKELGAWLQRQIKGAEIICCEKIIGQFEKIERKKEQMFFWVVEVFGEMRVTDCNALTQSLTNGAGRCKGFGYGMIALDGSMAYRLLGM